jgi:hypothetical protein
VTIKPPPPIITTEDTPRSNLGYRNPEYCRLSEELNPVRKNPQQILVFCSFGAIGHGVGGGLSYATGVYIYIYIYIST